jgi:hypothetical protein
VSLNSRILTRVHCSISLLDIDPNPPPPYSPPHTQPSVTTPPLSSSGNRPRLPGLQTQMMSQPASMEYTPVSAVTIVSPHCSLDIHRQNMRSTMSPLNPNQAQQNFPPPPGRDRSGSRSRGRFGLSSLTRGLSSDRSAAQEGSSPTPSRASSRQPLDSAVHFTRRTNVNAASHRSSVYIQPTEPLFQAPAARRSASAGAPTTPQNEVSGFPIPPPPPGPPPASSRSTSVSGTEDRIPKQTTVPILSMPTRKPRNTLTMTLEPIPPTPAGWIDTPLQQPKANESARRGESTHSERSYNSNSERLSRAANSSDSSNLRNMDKRDSTVKGIRERRSESRAASRAAKDRQIASPEDANAEQKPSDLVLNLPNSNIIRQGAVKKSKASMSPKDTSSSANVRVAGRRSTMTDTIRAGSPMSASNAAGGSYSAPPSGGLVESFSSALPASPYPPGFIKVGESSTGRQPRSAGKLPLRRTTSDDEYDAFTKASVKRHEEFIEKERKAATEKERLQLFAEYIVIESRLRRDRYAEAFTAMSASDILDLTRDLWKRFQPPPQSASRARTPLNRRSTDQSESFDSHGSSSPLSSRADWTPRTESESPSNGNLPTSRENNARQYQPVLSPIPSMAMSTAQDELESRGRSKSRWWESDSGSTGPGRKIERTKRESKYMGLHPDARFNLQFEDEPSPSIATLGTPARTGSAGEYPPEKVGLHDEEYRDPPVLSPPSQSVPNTPSATAGLDVSRLVTLPPPYPRHYPAMSNNHPDLATFRTTIRMLNDVADIEERKAAFTAKVTRQRAIAAQESAAREAQMHHNISEQIRLGQMNWKTAGEAEENFRVGEAKEKQAALRKEFDDFAPEVQTPLKALLSERITKANACISQLRDGLSDSAKPDAPMEEGDERPELLEKLKLIKWLVEAREALHRHMFDLEADKSARFRDMMLADLRNRGEDESKIADAAAFFRRDAIDRWAAYERGTRDRLEELQAVVQRHVDRGVQDQLSAFWDIAPRLLEVVKRIPTEDDEQLESLMVSVPHKEIGENPAFGEFPLQYLYGLLGHAQKATYQFIENQVGLMCLTHEVGMAVMGAGIRVLKTERCVEEGLAEGDEYLEREMLEVSGFEEQRLTRDLKDRVAEVESQWEEALGNDLTRCSESVERVLKLVGGWDEDFLKG